MLATINVDEKLLVKIHYFSTFLSQYYRLYSQDDFDEILMKKQRFWNFVTNIENLSST